MRATGLVVICLLVCASARADDTHYQDYLVGGRAIGLGGAFCALADDSSGVWFNPAGLADVGSSNLQLSTSLYGFERGKIGSGGGIPVPGVPNLNDAFTDLVVIPASAGGAIAFGERDENGKATQGIGAAIIIPSYRSSSPGTSEDLASTSYKRRVTDREIWAGLGYGARVTSKLRLGLSAFYVLRSVADTEQLAYAADDTSAAAPFETVFSDITLANGSLLLNGGAKLVLDEHWNVGISLRSPSLRIHSSGAIQYTRATSEPSTGLSSVERVVLDALDSQTKQAPSLRAGVSYVQVKHFTLAADVTAHAPVSYTLVDVPRSTRERLPFTTEIERRAIANLNVGGEYLVATWLSVAGGFFTDFSTAPRIREPLAADQPPRLNLYGTTASLAYISDHMITRLGLLYSFGTGLDVRPVSDLTRLGEGTNAFTTQELTQSFFYLYVSSTFRY